MKKYAPLLNPKFYLSTFYYMLGIFSAKKLKAVNFFEKSLEIYPTAILEYFCNRNIGVVYYYNDFFEKAKLHLLKAKSLINENEGDTELLTFLGLVYYTEANYQESKNYLEKALKKHGKYEWIKKSFIITHLKAIENFLNESGDTYRNPN